jgi:ABC-type glycerol-3-phosphate transport system substrate-binding protein
MKMMKRLATLAGAALAMLVASGAAVASVQQTPSSETSLLATAELRVVTANLAFRGADAVRNDWNTIGPAADIVFLQEAKNVNLRVSVLRTAS